MLRKVLVCFAAVVLVGASFVPEDAFAAYRGRGARVSSYGGGTARSIGGYRGGRYAVAGRGYGYRGGAYRGAAIGAAAIGAAAVGAAVGAATYGGYYGGYNNSYGYYGGDPGYYGAYGGGYPGGYYDGAYGGYPGGVYYGGYDIYGNPNNRGGLVGGSDVGTYRQ